MLYYLIYRGPPLKYYSRLKICYLRYEIFVFSMPTIENFYIFITYRVILVSNLCLECWNMK